MGLPPAPLGLPIPWGIFYPAISIYPIIHSVVLVTLQFVPSLTYLVENWINSLLPARSFGKIILTTSAGIMDHEEARRKHVGGKILAYVY